MELAEIRSEIEELKKYRNLLSMLEKETIDVKKENQDSIKDKPKVKKLEVRKNEHI